MQTKVLVVGKTKDEAIYSTDKDSCPTTGPGERSQRTQFPDALAWMQGSRMRQVVEIRFMTSHMVLISFLTAHHLQRRIA